MIENDKQLMYAYETLVKMNRLMERSASEPLWHPEGRKDVVVGIENQMQKIEREIADYLAKREGGEKAKQVV